MEIADPAGGNRERREHAARADLGLDASGWVFDADRAAVRVLRTREDRPAGVVTAGPRGVAMRAVRADRLAASAFWAEAAIVGMWSDRTQDARGTGVGSAHRSGGSPA
jgi:hypothetical protein